MTLSDFLRRILSYSVYYVELSQTSLGYSVNILEIF